MKGPWFIVGVMATVVLAVYAVDIVNWFRRKK